MKKRSRILISTRDLLSAYDLSNRINRLLYLGALNPRAKMRHIELAILRETAAGRLAETQPREDKFFNRYELSLAGREWLEQARANIF